MKSSSQQIRVVVADDMPEMVDAVAKVLAPGCTVIARAGDGDALVEYALALAPDLLVTDVSMPKLNGIEALRRLRHLGVKIPAIALTVHEDEELVNEALSLGVQGFVLKRRLVADLPLALRDVLMGRTFVSETIRKKVPKADSATNLEGAPKVGGLAAEILLDGFGLFIARTEGMEWQLGAAPGCQWKVLFVDGRQCVTSLVRMQAGTHFPAHRHGGEEEVFLLDGDLVVEGQIMKPGDYCRAETGSVHGETYTESGCTFLLRASQHDEIIQQS
jgi:DNA-binding NarL/FixJ family response regulator/quercetin dioxygenase-like cupin family protein